MPDAARDRRTSCRAIVKRDSSASRLSITSLCREAYTLQRLSIGRVAKYASDSSALTFSARPSMRTCRSSERQ